jgi:diguanylate cyclase (GGDEF)-like protein
VGLIMRLASRLQSLEGVNPNPRRLRASVAAGAALDWTDEYVRSLLKSFTGGSVEPANGSGDIVPLRSGSSDGAARRLELLDDFEQAGFSWIWATDADAKLIYLSASAAEQLGVAAEALHDRPLTSLFEIESELPGLQSSRPLNFQVAARNRIMEQVVRCTATRPGREPIWWSLTALPKLDGEGNFLGYRGSAKDVSLEYSRKLEDSRAAEYDSLTGLANRHRMNKRIDSYLAAFKSAKRSCACLLLDLDKFKAVNDTMGHPAGDQLLKQVAERLNNIIGKRGEIGRLGGDEFQIILPDVDDRGALGELAAKIVQIISQPYPIDGKQAIIGTSIGIGVAPFDGQDREELVRNTDLALYAAKNGGRGQYRFYSSDLKDEAAERAQMLDDLRLALDNGEVDLFYQPVVRTADNMVVGCEALMRWEHPERGPISPAIFIPVAEESSLIQVLGEFALRRACRDAAAWPDSVRVAVNVSAMQFANASFLELVKEVLDESGLSPDRLELELTESVLLGDSEMAGALFRELKALGVRLALDDFGTGFSSLSYLRSAPFDKIKVDRSFVNSATQADQNSVKIIAAIIGLADALGMETTVEGVEAFDQLELVCSKGAKFVQGYLYSRPLPVDDLIKRMESGQLRIAPSGPDKYRPERRSVFLRIGVIHEDHRYEAIMRDLSTTGARIEGLLGVPVGTDLVLDMGGGQLVVSRVSRSKDAEIGVEFESPLIGDGAGGLCTRFRISPYALAAAQKGWEEGRSRPQFMTVDVGSLRAA